MRSSLYRARNLWTQWENLQITVVFVHIVLMICQREREGSDQPIEADMELMWGQYGSITSNRGGVANIGDHPPPSNAISLCVYSVRSPALPSARTQCRAENIRTRVKSLQMSSILSPITQTWASSLQGTQPNQDIKRKNHFLIKAIMYWKIKMKKLSSLFEPPSAELVLSSFCFRPFYPFPPPCSSLLCTSFQCFVHIFSFPASCAGTLYFLQCQDWKSPVACFLQVDSWHPPKLGNNPSMIWKITSMDLLMVWEN